MKPICCNLIRTTAAVCVLMVSGLISAQDGVVRLSDQTSGSPHGSPMVRMSGPYPSTVHPAGFLHSTGCTTVCGDSQPGCCVPSGCSPSGCLPECGSPGYLTCSPSCTQTYGRDCVGFDVCGTSACHTCGPVCGCNSGCNSGCGPFGGGHFGGGCQCGPVCGCNHHCSYGHGHRHRMNSLFAQPVCTGSGCRAHDHWRGHSVSFLAKNAQLSNKLFGWLIPSGHGGAGLPPAGKYHMTYADQPGYADPRDAQLYAAQGYGIPVTVPLAPNVYQQYNYSWGVPASRITQISNYNPQTSPQPLYHQTWHSDLPAPPARNSHTPGYAVRRAANFLHPGHF